LKNDSVTVIDQPNNLDGQNISQNLLNLKNNRMYINDIGQ